MTPQDIILFGLRNKFRFEVSIGTITTEDLFFIPLKMLDEAAVKLNKELKDSLSESFLKEAPTDLTKQYKLEILKFVIETLMEEKKVESEKKAKAAEKKRLLEILNRKQEQTLENLTPEELVARIQELG